MVQQVNLANPIFLQEKHYLSANSMALALVAIMIFGMVLIGFVLRNIQQTQITFRQLIERNQQEIDAQKAVIVTTKGNAAPADTALLQQQQATEKALQALEQQWAELQRGLFRPGFGHSARLALVAQSVPAQVWVTELRADELRFSISGFTLEPAALNDWVATLSASPLLSGQTLATVKIERVVANSNTSSNAGLGSSSSGAGGAASALAGPGPGNPSLSLQGLSLPGLSAGSLGQITQMVQNLTQQNLSAQNLGSQNPAPQPPETPTGSAQTQAKAVASVPVWSFTLVSAVASSGSKESAARP
jgi:Tfp pilus assembly protein PilN